VILPQIAVPKNQLDNRQISLDDTFKLLPYESPFQTGGTISFRHPSYVLRKSDIDLEALLKNNSFICLQGDFGYGKSSLLMRVPDMLPHGWEPIEQKFDLQKTGGMDSIEKAFFERLKKVDIKLQDWVSVGEYLKRNKLIFLIDEIIFCSDQIAAKFIRKIYALVEDAPSDHVRVILTFRGSLRDHIGEIGLKNPILKNPKYRDCWKIVELTPLEESDLIKLLKLFPQPVDIILQEKLSTIKKCTLMGPRDVQKLCDGLWMRLRRKTIPANEINGQVQSYLEEYERYEGK
jgi:hypothetical protein